MSGDGDAMTRIIALRSKRLFPFLARPIGVFCVRSTDRARQLHVSGVHIPCFYSVGKVHFRKLRAVTSQLDDPSGCLPLVGSTAVSCRLCHSVLLTKADLLLLPECVGWWWWVGGNMLPSPLRPLSTCTGAFFPVPMVTLLYSSRFSKAKGLAVVLAGLKSERPTVFGLLRVIH